MKNTQASFFQPFSRIVILTLALAAFAPHQAWAEKTSNTPEIKGKIVLAQAIKLKRGEMSNIRAGFIDPSGFIYKFAVDVKTQIDGALTFVRSLVITPNANKKFNAIASTQTIPQETITAQTTHDGKGAVITSKDGGTTAILTQSTKGTFANIILNTANDKNITQTMNIDLVLHNLSATFGPLAGLQGSSLPSGLRRAARMHSVGFGF